MLLSIFLTFFKIGLFTFGGGYAMISNMKEAIVEKKGWLSEDELLEVIVIAESTPGPIAINLATYVGYKKKGIFGSVLATLGVVLPSVVILYTISLFLEDFMANKYVAYAFNGIKSAVAFLILKAGIGIFKGIAKSPVSIVTFSLALAMMLLFTLFSVSFSAIVFILFGGAFGILFYSLLKGEGVK